MNIIYDNKKKIMWDQLLIIIVALAMIGAAAYAIYSSNRSYLTKSGANNVRQNTPDIDAPTDDNATQFMSDDPSAQVQQGTTLEQGSTSTPQEAGTSNPIDPIDPNYCDHRFMECAYPAD